MHVSIHNQIRKQTVPYYSIYTVYIFLLILLKYSNFDRKWSLPMNRLKNSNKYTIANKIRRAKRMFVDLSIKFTIALYTVWFFELFLLLKCFVFFSLLFSIHSVIWTDLWPEKSVLIKLYCKLVLRIHNNICEQKKITIW